MLTTGHKETEQSLILRDYVVIHVAATKESQSTTGPTHGVLLAHEELFQRSVKQRGQLNTTRQKGNNVVYRGKREQARPQKPLLRNSA
jgi:hypothetical protein